METVTREKDKMKICISTANARNSFFEGYWTITSEEKYENHGKL